MATIKFNGKEVPNDATLSTTDIINPIYTYNDNSDITAILVYANGGYVQWLRYNEQEIFPLLTQINPGIYTFYIFNSTNLDILGLVDGSTRENLTTKFKGRVFGKLIDKIRLNVVGSRLVNIPFTVTRESLLNNSSIEEIRNVCNSSNDVASKTCNNELFLGDLTNKYLISDLGDAREYAQGKDWSEVIKTIEDAQEWLNAGTIPSREILSFDKIINQMTRTGRYINVRSYLVGAMLDEIDHNKYDKFKKYVRVLTYIEPNNAYIRIFPNIIHNKEAIDLLIQMMTDDEFDKVVMNMRNRHDFVALMALKPYLSEEDYNDAVNYRKEGEIDVISDIDMNEDILEDLVHNLTHNAEDNEGILHYQVDNRRAILQPLRPLTLQQLIQRFGQQQIVDGVTFRLVR